MIKDNKFQCSNCNAIFSKWHGQCKDCNEWNTIVAINARNLHPIKGFDREYVKLLSEIVTEPNLRISTGIEEFDRVLGGGLVRGEVVLIGGDPGIGKSTLLLQTIANLALKKSDKSVLYVSGEESLEQIALRAKRLEIDLEKLQKIKIIAETKLEFIIEVCRIERPIVLVMDSIQTVMNENSASGAGSLQQIKECTAKLTNWAKSTGSSLFLIGHVNKEGNLAGPRVLEHMVDAVIYFEGDSSANFRIVRSKKNRFGTINEIGIFSMTKRGLREVNNPSALFLSDSRFVEEEIKKTIKFRPGTSVFPSQEGTRPLLLEIQALVDSNHVINPRRFCLGLDSHRLPMLLAVVQKYCGISCFDNDVYVNAVGGLKVIEPSADLSIVLSIISSIRSKSLPDGLVAFGEIGLAGEIRACSKGISRLKESAKLGFSKAIIPKANVPKQKTSSIKIYGISQLSDVLNLI